MGPLGIHWGPDIETELNVLGDKKWTEQQEEAWSVATASTNWLSRVLSAKRTLVLSTYVDISELLEMRKMRDVLPCRALHRSSCNMCTECKWECTYTRWLSHASIICAFTITPTTHVMRGAS